MYIQTNNIRYHKVVRCSSLVGVLVGRPSATTNDHTDQPMITICWDMTVVLTRYSCRSQSTVINPQFIDHSHASTKISRSTNGPPLLAPVVSSRHFAFKGCWGVKIDRYTLINRWWQSTNELHSLVFELQCELQGEPSGFYWSVAMRLLPRVIDWSRTEQWIAISKLDSNNHD